MEKKEIAKLAHDVKTKENLLCLINRLKEEEMKAAGLSDKYCPFTIEQLDCYSAPNCNLYKQFQIRKKNGGFRLISAPKDYSFKMMLHYVNEILKAIYTPSIFANGFVEDRSVVDNAMVHQGMNYIFNTDLKDFFPSIHRHRVCERLKCKPQNLNPEIAEVLSRLCSMMGGIPGKGTVPYILPQGAPTSPILSNMVCDKLDRRLGGLAKRFNLNYSRYADDITFSSMHNVYQEDSTFRKRLSDIIETEGFAINKSKTRLQKRGSRQEVTGLVVNSKVNVSQRYVRDIRNILYIWDKYGYNTAYGRFFVKYKQDKGHIKKGIPGLSEVIRGKLLYLKMVKGEDDSTYRRLYAKYTSLMATRHDDSDSSQDTEAIINSDNAVDINQLIIDLENLLIQ